MISIVYYHHSWRYKSFREINKQNINHKTTHRLQRTTMESPTKTVRPLELHSPSNSNIDDTPSPNDGKGSDMKGTTPSSSSIVVAQARMPADDDDNNENENRHTSTTNNDEEDGRYEHPFYLSPIGRMDLSTPSTAAAATDTNNDMTLETPNNNNSARREGEEEVNESFPDNRDETIEIHSSTNYNDNDDSNETDSLIGDLDDVLNEMNGTAAEEENQDDAEDVDDDDEEEDDDNYNEEEEEETEEERMQREIEESEALARQLMGKNVEEIVVLFLVQLLFSARLCRCLTLYHFISTH